MMDDATSRSTLANSFDRPDDDDDDDDDDDEDEDDGVLLLLPLLPLLDVVDFSFCIIVVISRCICRPLLGSRMILLSVTRV